MLGGLSKALEQAFDPSFRAVALKTFAISAALFFALIALVGWLLGELALFDISWLDWIVRVLGGAGAIVISILLFPAVAMTVVGLFLEEIADAVDARYYPEKPAAAGASAGASLASAARLIAVAVALNLLVLPLYLIPGLNLFVFFGLNGYLLGREYFELVALRRMDASAARTLRRRFRWRLIFAGMLITVLLSIPVINWLMPMIATAFMVHEMEGIGRRAAPARCRDATGNDA